MKQGMLKAADDFRNNSNSKTGENFVYCFNAYIKFQMYANSYATTWLKDYLKGGEISDIANWIYHKENVSTATGLINVCKRQNKYRQSLMDNESKYAGIYFSKYEIDDEEVIPTGRQSSITINKGKTKKFVIDNVLTGAKIIYSSSNNKVAYADSKGVIKGVKSGTATITAQIMQDKKTYYVKLKVKIYDSKTEWYKAFLKLNKNRYRYYTIKNITNNKYPVLITAKNLYDPYFKGAKTADECYVYTYDGRNVIYIGKLTCRSGFCIMYADNKFYSARFRNTESYRVINNKFKVDIDSKLPSKAVNILFKENKF